MANNNTGDEGGRSWREMIENYNSPSKSSDANQAYKGNPYISIYFCKECRQCYEPFGNSYRKSYSADYMYKGFPAYGVTKKACPECDPKAWFWGCLGGHVSK